MKDIWMLIPMGAVCVILISDYGPLCLGPYVRRARRLWRARS